MRVCVYCVLCMKYENPGMEPANIVFTIYRIIVFIVDLLYHICDFRCHIDETGAMPWAFKSHYHIFGHIRFNLIIIFEMPVDWSR